MFFVFFFNFLISYFIFQYSIYIFFTAIPLGRILLLDLAAELEPIYTRTQGYFGHPFLWCMIENFGGNTRMYGMTDNVIQGNALFNALISLFRPTSVSNILDHLDIFYIL